MADQPLFSVVLLKQLCDNDTAFVNEMLRQFVDTVPASVAELNAAFDQNDFTSVSRIAHRLKPAIRHMDIDLLKEPIQVLEYLAAEQPDSPQIGILVHLVEGVLHKVCVQLQKTQYNH
ncbi:Hpt domain-containing protein [Runella slithyformis]|uniref:Hpt domain protein n=1 Tax=Runella slithyformis (strain ATCC 29530 / DSM 19594 / LMG 11500 / NCIMB 11436 / LSU 4) TaxID=761193 RepID=A0A7U3ZM20_RUNSL|nr:Hpt domain-containing protein [Runella slithyformis]AEI49680.1 Hpt domain protein [Runella slithyformis DSM 19594]